MECNNCGANLKDGVNFCPKCGSKVEEKLESVVSVEEQKVSDMPETPVATVSYPASQIPVVEVSDYASQPEPVVLQKKKHTTHSCNLLHHRDRICCCHSCRALLLEDFVNKGIEA